jgi:hypothetical protein
MLKPFREWDSIEKLIGVVTALAAVVGFVYAKLPWHATSVVVICLVFTMFLLFYPWRFPKWVEANSSKPADEFYPVMKWGWVCGIGLAALIGIGWSTTNFVWVKSPDILAGRLQEAHLDASQDRLMLSKGVWEAKLVQTNPPAPEVLVGLPTLDQNRLPQASNVRRCVPAIQALRAAFGELSPYSRDLRLVMIMAVFLGIGFAGAERMHEARLKADSRRRAAAAKKGGA